MMRDPNQSCQADLVAFAVHDLLSRLNREAGIPLPVLLAAAHGEIVTRLALAVGGEMAAERCSNAADHVRDIPSLSSLALAFAPPKGSA